MLLKGDSLFVALDKTPDYTAVLAVSDDKEEAEMVVLQERAYGPRIVEIDLGNLVSFLLEQGIAKEY